MGFNLRGAISGAAGVIGQQQGLRISAATQALRDAQLQKFQTSERVAGEGFIQGRAFVKIIYQSETGDWSVPDDIQRWDE